MSGTDLSNLPKWVSETTGCIWCDQAMRLYYLRPTLCEIQGWYICENNDCTYHKRYNKECIQGIALTGKFIEAYKIHLEKIEKDKQSKPAEAVA